MEDPEGVVLDRRGHQLGPPATAEGRRRGLHPSLHGRGDGEAAGDAGDGFAGGEAVR